MKEGRKKNRRLAILVTYEGKDSLVLFSSRPHIALKQLYHGGGCVCVCGGVGRGVCANLY